MRRIHVKSVFYEASRRFHREQARKLLMVCYRWCLHEAPVKKNSGSLWTNKMSLCSQSRLYNQSFTTRITFWTKKILCPPFSPDVFMLLFSSSCFDFISLGSIMIFLKNLYSHSRLGHQHNVAFFSRNKRASKVMFQTIAYYIIVTQQILSTSSTYIYSMNYSLRIWTQFCDRVIMRLNEWIRLPSI